MTANGESGHRTIDHVGIWPRGSQMRVRSNTPVSNYLDRGGSGSIHTVLEQLLAGGLQINMTLTAMALVPTGLIPGRGLLSKLEPDRSTFRI